MNPAFTSLALGAATGFLTSVFSWQINLVAIHRGLHRGKTAAFLLGLGAACADTLYALLAFTGAVSLVQFPKVWFFMKWIAAACIFYAGARLLIHKPLPEGKKEDRFSARDFTFGLILVGANPSLLIFWIGIITILMTHYPPVGMVRHRWVFIGGLLVGAAVWFLILCQAILDHAKQWQERHLRILSMISAAILIAVGIFILFENI